VSLAVIVDDRVDLRGTTLASSNGGSVTVELPSSASPTLFRLPSAGLEPIIGDPTTVLPELLPALAGLATVLEPEEPDSAEIERFSDCIVTTVNAEGLDGVVGEEIG